jgi:hypothetical protein
VGADQIVTEVPSAPPLGDLPSSRPNESRSHALTSACVAAIIHAFANEAA